jgi:hypothetical protein
VGDGEQRGADELAADRLLDQAVRLGVHCFVFWGVFGVCSGGGIW